MILYCHGKKFKTKKMYTDINFRVTVTFEERTFSYSHSVYVKLYILHTVYRLFSNNKNSST